MPSTHKALRSGTANKRPTTSIADGQIALNTNAASPGLFFKDSAGTVLIKIGPVHVGTTAPNVSPAVGGSTGNSTGEAWLDTSLTPNGWKVWTGTAWTNATPAGSETVQGLLELATNAETLAGTDTARAVTPAGLQAKMSDSVSTTSATTIASSTAVKTAYDLAATALPKTGGRVTGNIEIGPTGSLTFEGASDDAFETSIVVADPTADRTITVPNVTGTLVTTGDAGTVTSSMILDGTIVNACISASAAIVDSKLATIATAGKVSNSATTATNANTASAIVARDGSGNFSAGTITASLSGTASTVTTNANLTGDVTSVGNATSIAAGVIVDGDINASAAIADTKLATIATAGKVSNSATTATNLNTASAIVARDASGNFTAGTITAALAGNASTVTTNANLTGDVTSVGNATSIAAGVIVDADINASASIADTKLATITTSGKVSNSATTATSANSTSAIVARDASGNFAAGTITASLSGNASTVTTNANLTGDVTSVGNATSIAAGVIVDADINASASIADTKLATITTSGKVSNSATTATSANTGSAIVARDGSGNFSAGTITAALTGAASSNVLKSGDTLTGPLLVAAGTVALPGLALAGDPNTGFWSPSLGVLALVTNGVERHRATSDGRYQVTGAYDGNITAVSALDLDLSTANFFTKTINANSTFTVSNIPSSRAYAFTLELTHTSGTVTWFSGVTWPGGTAPSLTTGKVHLFMFVTDDGGTVWRASSLINY